MRTGPNIAIVSIADGSLALYALSLGIPLCRAAGPNSVLVIPTTAKQMWEACGQHWPTDIDIQTFDFRGIPSKVAALLRLAFVLRRHNVDIVHDVAGTVSRATWPFWVLISVFAELYITEHEPLPHERQRRFMDRFVRRVADVFSTGIFVHGQRSAQKLKERGCASRKIHVVRHGAYAAYGLPSNDEPSGPPSALVFGRLRPNKGYDRLPEIVRRTKEAIPDAEFVVAGSRGIAAGKSDLVKWHSQLDEIFREISAFPGVTVHDRFIADSEVAKYFKESTVALLPYKSASESGVLAVAAALAVPSVVTDVGDLAETVEKFGIGIVAANDSASIADKLIELLSSSQTRKAIRQRCLEFVSHSGHWSEIAREYLEFHTGVRRG
jgi:glycosyltransferase involved in cell wall biosynthesis